MAYKPQFFGPKAFGSVFDLLRNNLGWDKEPLTKKLSTMSLETGYVFAYLPKPLDSNEPADLLPSQETDADDPEGGRRGVRLFTYRFLQTRADSLALFVSDLYEHDAFFQNVKENPDAGSPHTQTPYLLVDSQNEKDRFVNFYLNANASTWDIKVGYRTSRGRGGAISVLTATPLARDLKPGQIVSDELLNEFVRQTDYIVFHIFCDSYLVWCREKPSDALLIGPSLSEYDGLPLQV